VNDILSNIELTITNTIIFIVIGILLPVTLAEVSDNDMNRVVELLGDMKDVQTDMKDALSDKWDSSIQDECDLSKSILMNCIWYITTKVTVSTNKLLISVIIKCEMTTGSCMELEENQSIQIIKSRILGIRGARLLDMRTSSELIMTEVHVTGFGSAGIIYAWSSNKVTIKSSTFSDNKGTAGGVLYMKAGGELIIRDSEFTDNAATQGGVAFLFKSTAHISGSRFLHNTATMRGGAIYSSSCHITFTGCDFKENTATHSLIPAMGGILYIYNSDSVTFTDCTASGNTAASSGDEIYCEATSSGGSTLTPISNGDETFNKDNHCTINQV